MLQSTNLPTEVIIIHKQRSRNSRYPSVLAFDNSWSREWLGLFWRPFSFHELIYRKLFVRSAKCRRENELVLLVAEFFAKIYPKSKTVIWNTYIYICRSQWPRGLRRRCSAARLLRMWVRIPPGAWMFACCECCVLSGRGLCDEVITRPEKSYRLWRVVVCDQETSKTRRLKPATGLWKYNHNGL